MNLILYRQITLKTSLTETEITNRLSDNLEKKRNSFTFTNTKSDKFFIGKFENSKFKIHQIIKGRNSFIPIIQGSITGDNTERNIELKMRLHLVSILFLVWVIGLISYYMWKTREYDGLIFISLMGIMTIFFFNQECNRTIKKLSDIFESKTEL